MNAPAKRDVDDRRTISNIDYLLSRRTILSEPANHPSRSYPATKGLLIGFGVVAAVVTFAFATLAGYSVGHALGAADVQGGTPIVTR